MENKKDIKIAIVGSGALGTALAKVLYDSNIRNIKIYGVDKLELKELSKGFNTKYFPNSVKLPKFETTSDLNDALDDADYVVIAVPSKVMHIVYPEILGSLNKPALIINGSKGFYPGTNHSLHEGIVKKSRQKKNIRGVVSLIGPSHAEEIVQSLPTVVASVSKKRKHAEEVQTLFFNKYFKTYIQTDVKGSETGATYKNVLAIASGMAHGLGYGINTMAALLTRGIAEMLRFNKVVGGNAKTIMGLTGIGDLIVTATSPLSRNFSFGVEFVKEPNKAMDTNATVEGLTALEIIYKISIDKNIDLPIVHFLYNAIFNNKNVENIFSALWNRDHKSE